jgi:hypothetical protein
MVRTNERKRERKQIRRTKNGEVGDRRRRKGLPALGSPVAVAAGRSGGREGRRENCSVMDEGLSYVKQKRERRA